MCPRSIAWHERANVARTTHIYIAMTAKVAGTAAHWLGTHVEGIAPRDTLHRLDEQVGNPLARAAQLAGRRHQHLTWQETLLIW